MCIYLKTKQKDKGFLTVFRILRVLRFHHVFTNSPCSRIEFLFKLSSRWISHYSISSPLGGWSDLMHYAIYMSCKRLYIYIGIKRETNKQKKLKRGKVSIRKSFLWNMKTFFSIRKIRNKSLFFILLLLRVWFEIIPLLKSVLYNESFQNHCYTFYFFLLLNYYTSCKCLKSANLMITLITKLIYFLSKNKGSRGS